MQPESYAKWLAAFRLASKGKTIASTAYVVEKQTILSFLKPQLAAEKDKSRSGGSRAELSGPDVMTRTTTGTLAAEPGAGARSVSNTDGLQLEAGTLRRGSQGSGAGNTGTMRSTASGGGLTLPRHPSQALLEGLKIEDFLPPTLLKKYSYKQVPPRIHIRPPLIALFSSAADLIVLIARTRILIC